MTLQVIGTGALPMKELEGLPLFDCRSNKTKGGIALLFTKVKEQKGV